MPFFSSVEGYDGNLELKALGNMQDSGHSTWNASCEDSERLSIRRDRFSSKFDSVSLLSGAVGRKSYSHGNQVFKEYRTEENKRSNRNAPPGPTCSRSDSKRSYYGTSSFDNAPFPYEASESIGKKDNYRGGLRYRTRGRFYPANDYHFSTVGPQKHHDSRDGQLPSRFSDEKPDFSRDRMHRGSTVFSRERPHRNRSRSHCKWNMDYKECKGRSTSRELGNKDKSNSPPRIRRSPSYGLERQNTGTSVCSSDRVSDSALNEMNNNESTSAITSTMNSENPDNTLCFNVGNSEELEESKRRRCIGNHFDALDNQRVDVSVVGGSIRNLPRAVNRLEDSSEVIGKDVLLALQQEGYERLTPIQRYGFPIISSGYDVLASAQTGSGKTLAFLCPIIGKLINDGPFFRPYFPGNHAQASPLALILCPTRELTLQIDEQATMLVSKTHLSTMVFYGGETCSEQIADINRRQGDVVIATPGRLVDLCDACKVSLGFIKFLVLDEADIMLSMGFEKQIKSLFCERDLTDKDQRQSLLFSATYPEKLQDLVYTILKTPFVRICVGHPKASTAAIKQIVKFIEESSKSRELLTDIYASSGKIIVFVGQRNMIYSVLSFLRRDGLDAEPLHGKMDQAQRQEVYNEYRDNKFRILVATSIAARGLDFPDVSMVINYDMPSNFDDYVHRIGRTGRIGNEGIAISYFNNKDRHASYKLVAHLQKTNQIVPDWLMRIASNRKH